MEVVFQRAETGGGEAINVGSMLAGEECFGEKNQEERWGVMLHLE